MDKSINRLLMQFEQLLKTTNKEQINPKIDELCINDLQPIVELVARSRAEYLEHLYTLCKQYEGTENFPSNDEMQKLRAHRLRFEELAEGSKAFETSIQRGYLDLKD
jgi:hypothetical protein